MSELRSQHDLNAWDQFWFGRCETRRIAGVRGLLCLITAIYFISSWSDAEFWYTDGGPLSPTRVATFLQTSGLQGAARWIVSPLFLTDSLWIYQLYLVVGVVLCGMVAAGRGGRIAAWATWLMLVGWANRAMIVSGLAETLLSLGLFAAAIAPPRAAWKAEDDANTDWSAGLAERVIAVQITVIGLATFITMLAGRVWFNGLGAYAMAAPAVDRTFDWTEPGSLLVQTFVHEPLTHLMVIALPVGFFLAWLPRTSRIGQGILIGWCVVVALLGSHWLYTAAFATMVLAIAPSKSEFAPSTSA